MAKEYIEREVALSHPFANGHYDHEHAPEDFILGYESYKEWLEQLPVADVVEVVRCKDCKYSCGDCIVKDMLWCNLKESPDYTVRKDFFCAYGERKDTDMREVQR